MAARDAMSADDASVSATGGVPCHIVYPEEVTACGASTTRWDVLAWRTDRTDAVVHRATWLGGPGGRTYELCEACIAAHRARSGR